MYIIVSDDLEEIHRCSVKFEDKNRILVITSNIKSSHVLGCINVTSNLTYLGNDNKIILKRINDIYEKNKKS